MSKPNNENSFVHQPVYVGGPKALSEFIGKNVQYPEEALKAGIEGTVTVQFNINHKGDVLDAKVVKGIGYGLDEEAIRVISLLSYTVKKPRNLRVTFHRSLNIHFKLPVQTAKPVEALPTTITYTYSTPPTPKPITEEKETPKTSYTYTVVI